MHNYWHILLDKDILLAIKGSGAEVWVAEHPLGPWTNMHLDINPASILGFTIYTHYSLLITSISEHSGSYDKPLMAQSINNKPTNVYQPTKTD